MHTWKAQVKCDIKAADIYSQLQGIGSSHSPQLPIVQCCLYLTPLLQQQTAYLGFRVYYQRVSSEKDERHSPQLLIMQCCLSLMLLLQRHDGVHATILADMTSTAAVNVMRGTVHSCLSCSAASVSRSFYNYNGSVRVNSSEGLRSHASLPPFWAALTVSTYLL